LIVTVGGVVSVTTVTELLALLIAVQLWKTAVTVYVKAPAVVMPV